MSIGSLCNRQVISARRDTPIPEAAQIMRQNHVGDLVVVDEMGGRRVPVGIVTDRDIVIEIVARGEDAKAFTAGDIMSLKLVTAPETEGVFETIELMRVSGVRRIPIVDRTGGLAGIVSLDDLFALVAEEMAELSKIVVRERAQEAQARL